VVLVLVQFLDFFVLNAEEGFEREKDGDRGGGERGNGVVGAVLVEVRSVHVI